MTIFERGNDVFTLAPDATFGTDGLEAIGVLTDVDVGDFREQQSDFSEAGFVLGFSSVTPTSNIAIPRARPHAIFWAGVKQQHFLRHSSADRQAHGRS